jgi:hypothetical protein
VGEGESSQVCEWHEGLSLLGVKEPSSGAFLKTVYNVIERVIWQVWQSNLRVESTSQQQPMI